MSIEILKKYNIKAKKALWQNFLVNDLIVEDISNITPVSWKNIVEVWPWYWALTDKLLTKKPKNLSLVELDKDMISILETRKDNWDFDLDWINFEINNTDILKFSPEFKDYSVIANIPYYITSPILRHFLYGVQNKPESMVILMQKDVWDKIVSWFEEKKWKVRSSVLSLFIAKKANVKEVLFVWKENFVPAPKVESSVLLFESHDLYNEIDDGFFLDIIKKWFSSPRKKLSKNLLLWWLDKKVIEDVFWVLKIDLWVRWWDLDIETWCSLVIKLYDRNWEV